MISFPDQDQVTWLTVPVPKRGGPLRGHAVTGLIPVGIDRREKVITPQTAFD